MHEWLLNSWLTLNDFSTRLFTVVFPELPGIGIWVVVLSLALFVFYLVRADIGTAFKVAIASFLLIAFGLFSLHHLGKLLHVSQWF